MFKTRCEYVHVRSLRPSLGATLRAACAVQIVYPDDLSSPSMAGDVLEHVIPTCHHSGRCRSVTELDFIDSVSSAAK